ncbi:hypothetical protein BJ983_005728 [Actinomycetospora corticicola]|uniref:Uncharacterized protein n=1 Tax=Actinomycetospora corticicola TaxID=663602 RepID=A0A7Y9E1W1_9PSEU|nr:hypothetical protein [Actinomycetospora corticicola]
MSRNRAQRDRCGTGSTGEVSGSKSLIAVLVLVVLVSSRPLERLVIDDGERT